MRRTPNKKTVVIRNTKSKLRSYLPAFEALLGGANGRGATAYFTETKVISDKQIVMFSVAQGEDSTAVLSVKQRMGIFQKHLPENKVNADKVVYPPAWAASSSHIFFVAIPLNSDAQKSLVKLTHNAIIEQGAMCEAMHFLNEFAKLNENTVSKETLQELYKQVSKTIGYDLPAIHYAHKDQVRERTDYLLSMIPNEKDRAKAAKMIDINLALAVKEVTARFEGQGLKIPEPQFKVRGNSKPAPI